MSQTDDGAPVDALRLAVVDSRIQGVVGAMMNTLLRTARSGVLNQARDFSCCVLTAGHELLSAADSLPIHVMSGPDLMARSMAELHPRLQRGDAFLHNSPYHGGSHPADHAILVPVLDDDGRHRFTVLAKGHQADIGNALPTTYMAGARDVYEEGALIFPCVQVQRDYRDVEDVIRMCRQRIRVPEQWWGDYLALLGAARVGERRVLALADELGWDALDRHAADWFDYSEGTMRRAIGALPEGQVAVEGRHDPFPGVPDGLPVRAVVRVEAREERVVVDLRDNEDAVPCGLNLPEACSITSAMIGVFNSLGTPVPANAGSFRRVEVLIRDGSVAGRALHPSSCSAGTTNVADRVANAVQRGFAELGDGYGLAETGVAMPPSLPVISGRDPRRGDEAFVNQLCLTSTGGAGGPAADGWLTMVHAGNGGMLLRDSVEGDEYQFPIRVERQLLVPDTEGAGRHRGAPSAVVELTAVDATVEAIFASDGSVEPIAGVRGGGPGGPARQGHRRLGGEVVPLGGSDRVAIAPGEGVVAITCGGGGYGSPLDREPVRVAHDVAEGWVSASRALETYGVVLGEDGAADLAATEDERRRRRQEAAA